MNSQLDDLYREVILDHNKRPRNFRVIEDAQQAIGYNPLCGDRLTVYLRVENGRIQDAAFQGSGCAISKASASLMTEAVKGKTVEQANQLFTRFHRMITQPPDEAVDELGKLSVFAGVRQFPLRVKCASLPWHALHSAIEAPQEPAGPDNAAAGNADDTESPAHSAGNAAPPEQPNVVSTE